MTGEQLLKKEILIVSARFNGESLQSEGITIANVDSLYSDLVDADMHWDAKEEVRQSYTDETGLECEFSRNYDSDAVARKVSDGTWVGWTYWHGGGKHGEPGAIPWIEDAYLLDVETEKKMVEVHTFKKKEQ